MRSTTALAAVLSLGAAAAGAGTIYWSGLGREGIWSDPDNWADAEDNPIEGDAPGLDGMPVGIVLGEAATGPIGLETGRATLSALELTDNSGTTLTDGTLAFSLPDGASGTAARLTVAGSGDFMGESLAFDLEDDLLVEASVDTGLSGNISGTGALRLRAEGDSEITLSGRNSQTGGTVIEAGTVAATGGEALSEAGAVTLAGGIDGRAASVLRIEQDETVGGLASVEGARGGLELADGSLTVSGGPASSFGLGISGSGGLTVSDGADLTLGAANSYEGGTVVSGGALTVTAGGSLGSGDVSVADGSLLTYGAALGADQTVTLGDGGLWTLAGDETVRGLAGTGTADLGGNRLDIALPGTDTLAFAGSLKGGADSLLALTGGGEYMLTGSLSDYRGGFRIEAGRLGLSDAGGALNDNALTLAGGTLVADLDNAFGGTIATEAGSASTITAAAGTTLSLTGGMALAGDLSFTAEGEAAEIGLKMASVTLQEGVSLGFDRARFSIGSEAAAGMFAAEGGTRLGAEAVLDLAGHDVGIARLTGSGRILTDSGDAVLGLGDGTDFGGVLADGAAGRLALETDGTVRLTGDNSLTGGTSVNGGSLTLAGGGTLGDIEIASAGRFVLEDGSAGSVVNSGTGSSNAGTIAALTQKAGSFGNSGTVSGATSVEGGDLSNTGTLSDDVSVSGGSLTSSGSIGGDLDVTGGTATNSGRVGGKSSVGSGGVLVSEGGRFGDDLTIEGDTGSGAGTLRLSGTTTVAGDVTNDGNIETAGGKDTALNLTDGGGFTNNGSITAEDGSLTVAADTITISDGASMKGDIDFVGAVVNKGELDLENDLRDTLRTDEDGVTRIVASLDGAGNDVENDGRLELGADLSFTGVGEVSNSGTVEIGANGRLQAERIGNAGRLNLGAGAALEGTGNTLENTGTITVGNGGSVTDAGAIENRETGLIEFTGGGTIASDSDQSGDEPIRNAGRIVTTDGGDDTITLGGSNPNVLENLASGSLEIGDSDSVIGSATTLDNAGSVTIGSGSTLELAALATAAGGSLTNDGMLKAGSVTSAGSLTNNAGAEIASDVTSSGSLSNAGTISGDLSVTGGTATSSGSLQDVSVSGGALTVTAGSLTGLSVSGGAADVDVAVGGTADVTGGLLTIGADGSVAELTTVGSAGSLDTAGTLASLTSAGQVENSGTITGDVAVTGGRTENTGTIGGDVAASGGTFLSSGTVSGDVAATGGALASVSGRIDGALTAGSGSEARVTGDLALGGGLGIDAGGKFDLRSGTVTMAADTDAVNDGTAIIGDGTLKGGTGGSFRNRDGGQLSVTGTGRLETDLVNAEGARAEIDGTVAGAVENDGEIALGGTIDGPLGNDGTVTVAAGDTAGITGAIAGLGSYLVAGRLDFGGSFDLGREGETEGRLALGENATVSGDMVTSYGTVTLADGSRLEADLVSSGRLTASGSATVDGDLTLSDGAVLSLSDGTTGDRLDVTGDARLNGTIGMDIDLTDGAQSADAIYIDGVASGSVLLAFNDLTAGDYGQIRDRLDLLSYGSDGGLSVRSSGLPTSGSILYRLDRNAAGDGWGLISGANPAFGGLSSGLALTQSLIGSVVN
ncbi:beta strand repeat-containing protein, partial [Rhodovulum sulfidophilum]|uniref:beta strand repeat-containing protein n=1 Tax=Rhodovulum sulfidophilum TaxID=35806 RepID=UPI001F3E803E